MIPYFFFPVIDLGIFEIPTYHFMHGFAWVLFGILFLYEGARKNLDARKIFWGFVITMLGGFIGARIGGIVSHWSYFTEHPEDILNFAQGGWTESGGFIFAAIVGFSYMYVTKLPILQTLDAVSPALVARFGFSRIGCSAIHDHMGKIMAHPWPWGIEYEGEIRHETGMYSLFANIIIFIVLWKMRKKIKKPGVLYFWYLISYSVTVVIIRFFRAEDLEYVSDERIFGLTSTQYVAVGVFFIALLYYKYIVLRREKNEKQSVVQA